MTGTDSAGSTGPATGIERATTAEVCVLACAQAWRGDGEILASPMGVIPRLGAQLAQLTFAPDLVLSDGEAYLIGTDGNADGNKEKGEHGLEGWLPYRAVFDVVASGRRHVMMGASQLDRYGNQNISCIGDWKRPTSQLLGVRGAPGNTVNHPTSYWIPRHSPRVFVERVDLVCGVGYDRAAALGPPGNRFHQIRLVVTDLAVLDFDTPDHTMRLRSVHPGVTVPQVLAATGFELAVPDDVPATALPSPGDLDLIRGRLDPDGARDRELNR